VILRFRSAEARGNTGPVRGRAPRTIPPQSDAGDPPNIIIASRAGLSFNDFLVHLAPFIVVLMIVFVIVCRWLFRDAFHYREERVAAVMAQHDQLISSSDPETPLLGWLHLRLTWKNRPEHAAQSFHDWGSRGRRFKSCRPDGSNQPAGSGKKPRSGGLFHALKRSSLDHHFHDQQADEGVKLEPLAPSF
jgi:hypothetical protein